MALDQWWKNIDINDALEKEICHFVSLKDDNSQGVINSHFLYMKGVMINMVKISRLYQPSIV